MPTLTFIFAPGQDAATMNAPPMGGPNHPSPAILMAEGAIPPPQKPPRPNKVVPPTNGSVPLPNGHPRSACAPEQPAVLSNAPVSRRVPSRVPIRQRVVALIELVATEVLTVFPRPSSSPRHRHAGGKWLPPTISHGCHRWDSLKREPPEPKPRSMVRP